MADSKEQERKLVEGGSGGGDGDGSPLPPPYSQLPSVVVTANKAGTQPGPQATTVITGREAD